MAQEFREATRRNLLQDSSHCTDTEYSCINWLNAIVRCSKYIIVGLGGRGGGFEGEYFVYQKDILEQIHKKGWQACLLVVLCIS